MVLKNQMKSTTVQISKNVFGAVVSKIKLELTTVQKSKIEYRAVIYLKISKTILKSPLQIPIYLTIPKSVYNSFGDFLYLLTEETVSIEKHINKQKHNREKYEMEQIMNYVKPELLILAVVLYFIGIALKNTEKFPDKYIPSLYQTGDGIGAAIDQISQYTHDCFPPNN